MLCHRGCGLIAVYTNSRKKPCCNKAWQQCPTVKAKIGQANSVALKGHKQSEETKQKRANSLRGHVVTEETIEKIRQGNIKSHKEHPRVPWNKGKKGSQVAWNKGLKKQESLEIISRESEEYSNFRKYRNRVSVRTRKTYEQFKDEINPNNLPIGKCGVVGAHQVDHIITVRQGFEAGMLIEIISAKENLQMLPWLENALKYDGKNLRKTNKENEK